MSTKQEFAQWFLSLPGASDWYGANKVNAWANGSIASATYDNLFAQYNAGNSNYVLAIVQQHTGLVQPLLKNNDVYGPVIKFLESQLANQKGQAQAIHGTVDDTPLANQVISDNIGRTQASLVYYKGLQDAITS